MEEDYPDTSEIPEDECCICGSYDVKIVDPFGYPFCSNDAHRAQFLAVGRRLGWPALRIEGITGTYAIDSDPGAYLLTMICGTDERVVELLDALDEYEASQRKAS